jgi:tetratricopeptide (TPR) repeat protein
MAVVTSWLEKSHVGASGPEWNFTFSDRCLIAGRALWFYATKILCPHPLIFIYPRWRHMSLPQCPALILFPLAAITVVIALWLLRKRLGRGPLVAVLFFAGTLLPALGFINLYPMRYSFVADHFQYHACIGLIVLAAAALRKIPAPASTALAAIIIAILGFLTWRQGPIYHNQLTLWQDVVQHNPTSWMAQGNLGDEYAALSNRTDLPADQQHEYRRQAVACYAELYRLAPEQPLAHLKWGIVKEYDGDLAAAENEFNQSLRLAPTFTIAMNSLGMLMMRQHRTDEALAWYRKAVALDPGYAEARVNFGDALLATGDEDAAFAQYAQAAAVRPDNVEAQFKLGNMLLLDQHNPVEATYHYLAALASDPTRADIWVNLSAAFLERGNLDEAREDCGQALRLDPNLPQAKQLWQELERR